MTWQLWLVQESSAIIKQTWNNNININFASESHLQAVAHLAAKGQTGISFFVTSINVGTCEAINYKYP